MAARPRSQRQVQIQRSRELRDAGHTWAEVAHEFQETYRVNARVALRVAHGWSQGDVADQWNERWPDDPKSFKSISYWERWPADSGYAPSLEVLTRLAEIYACHLTDLLRDIGDHRGADPVHRARSELARLPAVVTTGEQERTQGTNGDVGASQAALRDLAKRIENSPAQEVADQLTMWASQLDPAFDRRSLLVKLGFAFTLAAATPSVDAPRPSGATAPGALDFSGIWRSEYSFYSDGRGQELASTHFVVIRQQGSALSVESLPHSTGSELRMELSLDGMSATGTWEERTSPTGYYKGAVYRGAMQLLVESGGQMTGRWLGFGKRFQINNGAWELRLESRSLSADSMSDFALRA
jgi:transcriptional regulator with XRE-family HTH domain